MIEISGMTLMIEISATVPASRRDSFEPGGGEGGCHLGSQIESGLEVLESTCGRIICNQEACRIKDN